jgi:hypothetical protein
MGALTGSGFRVAGAGGLSSIANMLGASNIKFRPAEDSDDDDDEDEQMGSVRQVEDADKVSEVKAVRILLFSHLVVKG